MKNFYEVLSLSRNANLDDIQARFRQLVRERHPDRFLGEEKLRAEKEFQQITEAFNVLRDPKRRYEHDQVLDRPVGASHDPSQTAKVYLGRGIKAYKQANYLAAADNFDRATKAEPGNHQAWHHLAMACFQEERWLEKAREGIDRAMDLKPNHLPYLKLAARVYLKSKMLPKAKEHYNQMIRLGGSDATVRKALESAGAVKAKASTGGEPGKEQGTEKAGLFGKLW